MPPMIVLIMSGDRGGASPHLPAPPHQTLMPSRKRPDWSRPLPRPLVIPGVMTLKTLADIRSLLGHLPKDVRARSAWQSVASQLDAAAGGADPADVAVALQLVLMLEKVEFRRK